MVTPGRKMGNSTFLSNYSHPKRIWGSESNPVKGESDDQPADKWNTDLTP